jgi:hypothetical protein
MWDRVIDYFLAQPGRLVAMGRTFVTAGFGIIFVGLVGQLATRAQHAIQQIAPHPAEMRGLAELYPDLWTWWVPETVAGAIPALCLIGFGRWLAVLGRRIERFCR